MAHRIGAVPVMLLLAHAAVAQLGQQGGKLVGTGSSGAANQGWSVAISSDSNTALVGGPTDNSSAGAAWVFTRSAGVWSQQGAKLVGTGAVGTPSQGWSVALSADGGTAVVGGPGDSPTGAIWVYTRSGGVWSQQGSKLVGAGAVGLAYEGGAVAISADGNTVIVGGLDDDTRTGAAWVFTRSGGVWSQQGGKLVGTGATGAARQGSSVAISADGNTAIVGGSRDDSNIGAAWVFVRSGGTWSQQGTKLVGAGAVGTAQQGTAAAVSADGSTAIVSGPSDDSGTGAAWVFTRTGGVWSQQGDKLVGTGAVAPSAQGYSLGISADGNTAVSGAFQDDGFTGAAWVFTRAAGTWSQQGNKLVGSGAGGRAEQGASVALSGDGSTAIVGGFNDDQSTGAAWVFSAPVPIGWVPVASHNSGVNHSEWRSDLGLLNTGAVTANVQMRFFGGGGVVPGTTYVPPGTQSMLTDVVAQIGGTGSGPIELLSDQPLRITARSYNMLSATASCFANGTLGQSYPVVLPSDGLVAGGSAYLGGLSENASYRCNIGLVNLGASDATVLVELFDGSGTKLTDYTVVLAAGQWAQETRPFMTKAGQTAMDRGYAKLTVQSGSGVFGFASLIDAITGDPTTVTMQR